MHIVAITGSLRAASCNTGILRSLLKTLPAGHTMEIVVPGNLPLFNVELEAPDKLPDSVKAYRNTLKTADCFIFAVNEYNFSVSGALKNAIDWGSRGADGGNLFNEKAGACVSAGGGKGGLRSTMHFRDIALYLNLHVLNKPELQINAFSDPRPFNSDGDLVAVDLQARGAEVTAALLAWCTRLAAK